MLLGRLSNQPTNISYSQSDEGLQPGHVNSNISSLVFAVIDARPTGPKAGKGQDNRWCINTQVTSMSRPGKSPTGTIVCLLVGCLTSQQQASVSQGRICSDNFTCCHTEIELADPTFYLTQSQYTDTGPTSPSADPITPGAWQGSHWSANF